MEMEIQGSKETSSLPARDFIDAADVRGIYLYRKDGYIFSYLRVLPFNLDLLSDEEKNALTEKLTAKLRNNRKDFIYASFPREVDLDGYKKNIKDRHQHEFNIGRRHILTGMMRQATVLTLGGNYEHQHFIRVWEKNKNRAKAEELLKDRISDFKQIYKENGIECEILGEKEITKQCNLYGNALQANFEHTDNAQYTPLLWIE